MSASSRDARAQRGRSWDVAIGVLVFSSTLYLVSRTIADPDIWGHVLFGLDILEEGSIPRTDPYSYLSGDWINHEWAAEVAFGVLFRLAGPLGLIVFKIALSLAIAAVVFRELRREGLDALRAGLLLILVVVLLLPGLYTVRPQLFTYAFYLCLLLILRGAERGKHRALWLLPPVFALWINFHGGVLAGLGAVGIWAGVHLVATLAGRLRGGEGDDRTAPRTSLLVGVLAASILAILVNPYGWELPAFLLRTGTVPRPDILEWKPLRILSQAGLAYVGTVTLGGIALARSERPRRPAILLLLAVTALLPLLAYRHLQLFALTFGILGAPHLADAFARRQVGSSPSAREIRLRPWFAGLAFSAAALMLAAGVPNLTCIRIDPDRAMGFPARAVGMLEASGIQGNMAVVFGWGEFAIWKLQPRVLVSMDGRRETVYPDSIYREYLQFQRGLGEWDAVLDRPATDLALVATDLPTYNLVRLKPGWDTAYEDSVAAIFVRTGLELGTRLSGAPVPAVPANGAGQCFP